MPRPLYTSVSDPGRSLLDRIGENDINQIKLVFDSIDKNRDGQLSLAELEHFAANLWWAFYTQPFATFYIPIT